MSFPMPHLRPDLLQPLFRSQSYYFTKQLAITASPLSACAATVLFLNATSTINLPSACTIACETPHGFSSEHQMPWD